jgi:hypothetical protein
MHCMGNTNIMIEQEFEVMCDKYNFDVSDIVQLQIYKS